MNTTTNPAPVDVLALLRSRFEGCNVDEGFAGGLFLHPADAKLVHDAVAGLIERGNEVVRNMGEEGSVWYEKLHVYDPDFLRDLNELRSAIARCGGAS